MALDAFTRAVRSELRPCLKVVHRVSTILEFRASVKATVFVVTVGKILLHQVNHSGHLERDPRTGPPKLVPKLVPLRDMGPVSHFLVLFSAPGSQEEPGAQDKACIAALRRLVDL
jgi:hypothetical protein